MVYTTRRLILNPTLCYFVLVLFSPFSIAITSLGDETANLSVFSYVCLICACFVLSVSPGCLGRAAICDCGTPWTFTFLTFLLIQMKCLQTIHMKCLAFLFIYFTGINILWLVHPIFSRKLCL